MVWEGQRRIWVPNSANGCSFRHICWLLVPSSDCHDFAPLVNPWAPQEYNGDRRMRHRVQSCKQVDWAAECKRLVEVIAKY